MLSLTRKKHKFRIFCHQQICAAYLPKPLFSRLNPRSCDSFGIGRRRRRSSCYGASRHPRPGAGAGGSQPRTRCRAGPVPYSDWRPSDGPTVTPRPRARSAHAPMSTLLTPTTIPIPSPPLPRPSPYPHPPPPSASLSSFRSPLLPRAAVVLRAAAHVCAFPIGYSSWLIPHLSSVPDGRASSRRRCFFD